MNNDAAWPTRNGPTSIQANRRRIGNDPNAPDVFPLKKSISIRVLISQLCSLSGVRVSNPSRVYRGVRTAFCPLPCGIGMLDVTKSSVLPIGRKSKMPSRRTNPYHLYLVSAKFPGSSRKKASWGSGKPANVRASLVTDGAAGSVAAGAVEGDGKVNGGGLDDRPVSGGV